MNKKHIFFRSNAFPEVPDHILLIMIEPITVMPVKGLFIKKNHI